MGLCLVRFDGVKRPDFIVVSVPFSCSDPNHTVGTAETGQTGISCHNSNGNTRPGCGFSSGRSGRGGQSGHRWPDPPIHRLTDSPIHHSHSYEIHRYIRAYSAFSCASAVNPSCGSAVNFPFPFRVFGVFRGSFLQLVVPAWHIAAYLRCIHRFTHSPLQRLVTRIDLD